MPQLEKAQLGGPATSHVMEMHERAIALGKLWQDRFVSLEIEVPGSSSHEVAQKNVIFSSHYTSYRSISAETVQIGAKCQ